MSVEHNKMLVNRIYDAFNHREIHAVKTLFTHDFVDHTASAHQKPGPDGIAQVWSRIWNKFPHVHILTEDIISEGSKVVCRVAFQNTDGLDNIQLGQMIEIFSCSEGKVNELWNMIMWH